MGKRVLVITSNLILSKLLKHSCGWDWMTARLSLSDVAATHTNSWTEFEQGSRKAGIFSTFSEPFRHLAMNRSISTEARRSLSLPPFTHLAKF